MNKDYIEMDWSNNYTYKERKIYIRLESKDYILCSFNDDGSKMFKLDKSIFNL